MVNTREWIWHYASVNAQNGMALRGLLKPCAIRRLGPLVSISNAKSERHYYLPPPRNLPPHSAVYFFELRFTTEISGNQELRGSLCSARAVAPTLIPAPASAPSAVQASAPAVNPFGNYPYGAASRLSRPRHPRMIAGVCSGLAQHYGWDVSLVRVIAVLLAVCTSGIGAIAYVAAWIIIPEEPYTLPHTTGTPTV